MALESGNGTGNNQENFEEFYEKWKDEQKYQLDDLITASKDLEQAQTDQLPSSLPGLVDRVIAHYEKYFSIKSEWVKTDVLLLLSPPWNSPLEDAFLWVGGWRPTTAFHLLYSKSSIQFEASFSDLLKGKEIGDLGDLSPEQVSLIDKLQRRTIKEEREITEKLAKQQGRVADREMVELSHKVSELTRVEGESNGGDDGGVDSVLKTKEEGFVMVLKRADDLRLGTLKGIVGILSAIQTVHFLIAAEELLRKMHDWGKEKQERESSTQGVS
ncbi:hypothetical protein ACS0TY_036825 [Phlomoides rotata]